MSVEMVPLGLIDANPWQTRLGDDPEHVAHIAADIYERWQAQPDDPQRGLMQVPLARRHPSREGRFQLAFGHTRRAAFGVLAMREHGELWARFPVLVRALSDRDMAELAARENAARKNLTAIETATALQRMITEFGCSQEEAGKAFGYTSQGAVSNLLRLLGLPKSVRQMVHDGRLAERHARALLPVVRMSANATERIADEMLAADVEVRDDVCHFALSKYYREHGTDLSGAIFAQDWLKQPIMTPAEVATAKSPAELRACEGCSYQVQARYGVRYCLLTACMQAKNQWYALTEARRASVHAGVTMVGPDEHVQTWWEGQAVLTPVVRAAVQAAPGLLRIVPHAQRHWMASEVEAVLGSQYVALATTDMAALRAQVPAVERYYAEREAWQQQAQEQRPAESMYAQTQAQFRAIRRRVRALAEVGKRYVARRWQATTGSMLRAQLLVFAGMLVGEEFDIESQVQGFDGMDISEQRQCTALAFLLAAYHDADNRADHFTADDFATLVEDMLEDDAPPDGWREVAVPAEPEGVGDDDEGDDDEGEDDEDDEGGELEALDEAALEAA